MFNLEIYILTFGKQDWKKRSSREVDEGRQLRAKFQAQGRNSKLVVVVGQASGTERNTSFACDVFE